MPSSARLCAWLGVCESDCSVPVAVSKAQVLDADCWCCCLSRIFLPLPPDSLSLCFAISSPERRIGCRSRSMEFSEAEPIRNSTITPKYDLSFSQSLLRIQSMQIRDKGCSSYKIILTRGLTH